MKNQIINTRSRIINGLTAAWPICIGYIPVGFAFGVLAEKAGLGPLEIFLMSSMVFAGSSQFVAVSMILAGATSISIIITTFAVNLRHMLMSSSLSVFLKKENRKRLFIFAYGITDESFAVNHSRFTDTSWDYTSAMVVNHIPNITWIICTVAGGLSGQFIPAGAFGIDYALIAMFICLLIFQLKGTVYVVTAIISGILAVIIALVIPGNLYIITASIIAATLGVVLKKTLLRASSNYQND